jgi:hypothetical protein
LLDTTTMVPLLLRTTLYPFIQSILFLCCHEIYAFKIRILTTTTAADTATATATNLFTLIIHDITVILTIHIANYITNSMIYSGCYMSKLPVQVITSTTVNSNVGGITPTPVDPPLSAWLHWLHDL